MRTRRRTLRDALKSTAAMPGDSFEAIGSSTRLDDARCGILVRVTPELRDELKLAAVARRTTVQALLLAAIVDVLKKPDRVHSQ